MTNHKTKIGEKQKPTIKNKNNDIHIALLYGGMSSEREVSIMSCKGINKELLELGYQVTPVDVGHDFIDAIRNVKADVIFNGLHGQYGEDGYIPAILDMHKMKYTHSGVTASALGFNKVHAYNMFKAAGIPFAHYVVVSKAQGLKADPMKRPYVIKPISDGSSVGVEVVFDEDDFNFANYDWKYGDSVIVQKYTPGREFQVAVLNDKAIGVTEVVPLKRRFYDYDSKYTDGFTKHITPAVIEKNIQDRIIALSEKAHKSIGSKTISRVEFRFNPEEGADGLYILEINTHPGMTPLSIVPEICAYHGITYKDILERLIKDALL